MNSLLCTVSEKGKVQFYDTAPSIPSDTADCKIFSQNEIPMYCAALTPYGWRFMLINRAKILKYQIKILIPVVCK